MATYLILNIVFMVVAVTVLRPRLSRRRYWGLMLGGLLLMTAIFDNAIILAGIVDYDPTKILGLKIGVAPIEDFFYAVFAALLIPALWERMKAK